MISSLPYKYLNFFEDIKPEHYISDMAKENLLNQVNNDSEEKLKENYSNFNLTTIFREMDNAWKNREQEQMIKSLNFLCDYSQYQPILYSIDIIKYKILDLLCGLLTFDTPPDILLKTLELISIIFTSPEKQLGNSMISKNSIFISLQNLLIDIFNCYCNFDQSKLSFIRPILICLDCISEFNIEGCIKTLQYFFKTSPSLIFQSIQMFQQSNFFNEDYITDDIYSFDLGIKESCYKLVRTISQMRICKNDCEQLFTFLCELPVVDLYGKPIYNKYHLVYAIRNMIKIIPEKWAFLITTTNALNIISQCLTFDEKMAVPSIWCIIQLLAQNALKSINYQYFVDLLQNMDLVSCSCWAIERILLLNCDDEYNHHAEQFASCNIFETFVDSLPNYSFAITSECINCICALVEAGNQYIFKRVLSNNIISLFLDYIQTIADELLIKKIIKSIEMIFQMGVVFNDMKSVYEQFNENDGFKIINEIFSGNSSNDDLHIYAENLINTINRINA